jgi:acetylornithine deacetylase/succinyl-diaminopimelate desuccinylase-like protein
VSELAELAAELVAVDSVNPDLVPGAAGESALARVVADWCERAGLEVEVEEAAPGRPNVIATARGTGGGRALMLNAHMDTVGVGGTDAGLRPRVDNGRLYGRGAYDMKGSLAAAMVAAARAKERRLRGDVTVTAVADEEAGSIGTEALVRRRTADAAIVAEPTGERVAVAHKGFVAFEIVTAGKAAHGSRSDLGVDAIARMGPVLVRLGELDRALYAGGAHELLGTGSIHASIIEGGQEYSSYPARCRLRGERRTIPDETVPRVELELATLLGELDGSVTVTFSRPPFEIAHDAEIVRLVLGACSDSEVIGVPFWADSALLAEKGIPTVVFGPIGDGAHAEVEWVDLESLQRCADVYLSVAQAFCA